MVGQEAAAAKPRSSRIPSTLQAVFLASNRGKDVHKPPPDQVAQKVFFRNIFAPFRNVSRSMSKRNRPTVVKDVSLTTQKAKQQPVTVNVAPTAPTEKPKTDQGVSPQAYLDIMISARGHPTTRTKTLQTAYYNKPTDLQMASYDVHLINLVRDRNVAEFRDVMSSGISPNPCNNFGESLIHMVCRRGDAELLQIMLDSGTDVQVVDDYGRTPLHDACWAAEPCFDVVELLLKLDSSMFHMTDRRGSVPLSYAHVDHWPRWIEWLEMKKDLYWPARPAAVQTNPLIELPPDSRPVPAPKMALTLELASMVASGRISPEEAKFLNVDDTVEDSDETDSEFDDSGSEYDDDYDEDDLEDGDESSSASLADDELADMFQSLSSAQTTN